MSAASRSNSKIWCRSSAALTWRKTLCIKYICWGRFMGWSVMAFCSTESATASASISPRKLLWNIDCISYDHVHGTPWEKRSRMRTGLHFGRQDNHMATFEKMKPRIRDFRLFDFLLIIRSRTTSARNWPANFWTQRPTSTSSCVE